MPIVILKFIRFTPLIADWRSQKLCAHGEYVLFVDSDDYFQKNSLRYLYEQASSFDLDILHFDGDIIYEEAELEQRFGKLKARYALSRPREYSDITDGQKLYCDM